MTKSLKCLKCHTFNIKFEEYILLHQNTKTGFRLRCSICYWKTSTYENKDKCLKQYKRFGKWLKLFK